MNIRQPLKGTYYENSTFPGIWGVVVDIWCSHTHTNFEKSLYLIFWVRYAFLKAARLKLPNERVSFSAHSYVGRGAHLNMTSHFPTPPFNQSISKTRPCVSWLEFIMSRIHKRCSVDGCMDVHKSLHRVPEDERATWIDFIFEGEVPAIVGKNLLVCANHFTTDCFSNFGQYTEGLAVKLYLYEGSLSILRGIPADEGHVSIQIISCVFL